MHHFNLLFLQHLANLFPWILFISNQARADTSIYWWSWITTPDLLKRMLPVIIMRFRLPETIHHDQGGEFEKRSSTTLRNWVGLNIHAQHPITRRVMGRSKGSTGRFYPCWEPYRRNRNPAGLTISISKFMHTTVPVMTLLDFHLSFYCLVETRRGIFHIS